MGTFLILDGIEDTLYFVRLFAQYATVSGSSDGD